MPSYQTFALDNFDSCVEPLSLADLQALDPSKDVLDHSLALKYGPTKGLLKLRDNISSLYQTCNITGDDVLVTAGAIHANFLVLDTLVEAGDHIIVQHPTYLQLVEIPRRAGAEVSLWKWRHNEKTNRWEMDLKELEDMIRPNTKMIVLSTPNNPLGSILSREELMSIVQIARVRDIIIMCDEVFRFLHHDRNVGPTPSLLEMVYEKSIVTGSLSKAFALPGIRIGWIAGSPEMRDHMDRIAHTRDYTTIAVSQVDQQIASFALSDTVRSKILERSKAICANNIEILKSWALEHAEWAEVSEARGGGTVVVKVVGMDEEVVDDEKFALALAEDESVCVPPAGRCFGHLADGSGDTDLRGCLRVGIVSSPADLQTGLDAIGRLRLRWN